MENPDSSCSTLLIDGDGTFNVVDVDNFVKKVELAQCGLSYAIVSIMGPQSSGKSTLLNHLFRTNFKEMDADMGRSQTTKGIWMARCVGIEPCTIVMDLEGSDGKERGEDDTTFEKQSALFALAVSDIVLINMWCSEIGREQAGNRPLLKTVFQAMMRLFSPRKTTLMFVIRDKSRTPLEKLESDLREDIQKIWTAVPKPQDHKETPLSDFFNVEVVALSNFEYMEEQFKEQVANLRQRFCNSIAPGGLAGDRRSVVPASGFAFSAQQIWKTIKDNKDLDLPSHKIMVATIRCEESANKIFSSFANNEEWRKLEVEVEVEVDSRLVISFGSKLTSMLKTCLSEYDFEATYFDGSVMSSKRKQLEEKLLLLVRPAFLSIVGHLRAGTLERFKEVFDDKLNKGEGFSLAARECTEFFQSQFDEGCQDVSITQANWDTSKARDKLKRDIEAHIEAVHTTKLSALTSLYEKKLNEALSGPVEALLDEAGDDTWPAIRKLFLRETDTAVSGFSAGLSGYQMDEVSREKMILRLRDHARGVVEGKAREEAGRVLIRMKDRFSTLFSHDSDSMPRVWTGKEDIRAIAKTARSSSLKLLSTVAAIRLDDYADNIVETLSLALVESTPAGADNKSTTDPLASSTWDQVPAEKTLITPVQCKSLWRQFKAETEDTVTQAISAQVMVATVRCEEMPKEIFSSFANSEEWRTLEEEVDSCLVLGFGEKLSSMLETCLSEYDLEVTYFDGSVRSSKRKLLEKKLLQLVQPAFLSMLGHLGAGTLERFEKVLDDELNKGEGFSLAARECAEFSLSQFDEGCQDASITQANWDTSQARYKLKRDIEAHIEAVRTTKLSALPSLYEKKLNKALSVPVEALLYVPGDDTWPAIRKLFLRETEAAASGFATALSGYELNEVTRDKMILRLRDHARGVVERKAREEARRVLIRMTDRFSTLLRHDSDSMPRVWTGKEDIRAIACSSSLKVLSALAAIRLDNNADNIGQTLSLALVETRPAGTANKSTTDPLASSTWDQVPAEKTLITPVQCKSLWRVFEAETYYTVTQPISAQGAPAAAAVGGAGMGSSIMAGVGAAAMTCVIM